MKAGFIGLGRMGKGVARRLLDSGVSLTVFDVDEEAARRFVDDGAVWAADPGEVASRVEVLFTSLPGPAQIDQVYRGAGGVVEGMRPGLVAFDLSTGSVALARQVGGEMARQGGAFMDAPVSGHPGGAASGELTLWVGGERAVFDEHLELLQVVGKWPCHLGEVGSGTITKLTHNLSAYMVLLAMSEAFSLATRAGIDPLSLWSALKRGVLGRNSPLDMLTGQFLPGVYEPASFALELGHKDVGLATELGRQLGVPMRIAALTLEEMTEGLARGLGQQDALSFMKLQLERAGVEIAVDPDELKAAIAEVRI
jgi:3-hydroxyisobutyrate dehydrogenase